MKPHATATVLFWDVDGGLHVGIIGAVTDQNAETVELAAVFMPNDVVRTCVPNVRRCEPGHTHSHCWEYQEVE